MCYNQKGATHDLLTCEQRLMCQHVAGKDAVVLDKKVNTANATLPLESRSASAYAPWAACDPAPAPALPFPLPLS